MGQKVCWDNCEQEMILKKESCLNLQIVTWLPQARDIHTSHIFNEYPYIFTFSFRFYKFFGSS